MVWRSQAFWDRIRAKRSVARNHICVYNENTQISGSLIGLLNADQVLLLSYIK